MTQKLMKGESRTIAQIREHYEIERDLAHRLQTASRSERRYLYAALYDEMFQRVPLHPQLTRKASPAQTERVVAAQMGLVKPFLRPDTTFLEVGPGDCALSFAVAKVVQQVYAVDVSDEITQSVVKPPNFQLVLSTAVMCRYP
jgi:methylase of polypeptide subunit release factors